MGLAKLRLLIEDILEGLDYPSYEYDDLHRALSDVFMDHVLIQEYIDNNYRRKDKGMLYLLATEKELELHRSIAAPLFTFCNGEKALKIIEFVTIINDWHELQRYILLNRYPEYESDIIIIDLAEKELCEN